MIRAKTTVSLRDLLRDALRTVVSRPGRSIALGLAVALGIATITGLSIVTESANERVERRLRDALPELVKASPNVVDPEAGTIFDAESLSRVSSQEGVRHVGIAESYGEVQISVESDGYTRQESANLLGSRGALLTATRTRVTGSSIALEGDDSAENIALLGSGVANRVGVADPAALPTVWIDGVPFLVAGILEESEYLALAADSVIILSTTADVLGFSRVSATAYALVERGEADLVADVLPLELTPNKPEQWYIEVPRSSLDRSEEISEDMKRLGYATAILVLVGGVVAIGNAMMRSVYDRMPELGLRQALGARRIHIFGLLLSEAALIGTLAGVTGYLLGMIVGSGIALKNHWPIVLSLQTGLAIGPVATVAGCLGGIVPASLAVRISPSQALRSE